ncbi:MAG: hypothetical protein ACLP5V_07900 [Candidatus Bathyarchaeia archaeon]
MRGSQVENDVSSAEFIVFALVAATSLLLRLAANSTNFGLFLTMFGAVAVAGPSSTSKKKQSGSTDSKLPDMLVFVSGSRDDPQPLAGVPSKRFARCITHNRIVHFSKVLLKWVYEDGSFHTGCQLETPKEWLPNPIENQVALEAARKQLTETSPF